MKTGQVNRDNLSGHIFRSVGRFMGALLGSPSRAENSRGQKRYSQEFVFPSFLRSPRELFQVNSYPWGRLDYICNSKTNKSVSVSVFFWKLI